MTLESPRPITVPYKDYFLDIYTREAYQARKDDLHNVVTDLTVRSGRWSSEEVAREVIRRRAEVKQKGNGMLLLPSVILFRREGEIVGFSKQGIRKLHTTIEGDVPVVQLESRMVLEQDRREGLGREAIRQLQVLYANYGTWGMVQRSASPAAFWSLLQAGVTEENPTGIFRAGYRFPWDRLYYECRLAQELATAFFFQIRLDGKTFDMTTGVSQDDYPEPNSAFELDITHEPTVRLNDIMRRKFHMGPRAALYGVYQWNI